ncbi:hypothetical protein C7451_101261 [Blastomonas natatoria]|uniref:Uncharacterized protein n=1 Tax=Blastomonas natatoria TaxID=34015 RepID=A0A2V3VBW9_9SPHN|nr:hypothetical protein [Blastomonas natatoria]PXW79197.1 hypothetical protein C7451_101261 [Blastomonas natatoria]
MTAATAHIRASTLISVIISMAISAAFFILVFGMKPLIAVFAPDNLALDFVPQTLAAGFMAALMPGLQTRAKMISGNLAGAPPLARAIVVRAGLLAGASLVLAAAVSGLLWLGGVETLPWGSALTLKIGYGGLLGLIITPIALRAILPRG